MEEKTAGRIPELVIRYAGAFSVVLGVIAILSWHLCLVVLLQMAPEWVPIHYNTAVCFVLCGIALSAAVRKNTLPTRIAGGLALAIAATSLLQYILTTDLHIDQLVIEEYVCYGGVHPGRMAPNSALCIALAGMAFLLNSGSRSGRWRPPALGLLGSVVVSLGAVALIGYVTGISAAFGWGSFHPMAVQAAAGFVVVGSGILALGWRNASLRDTGGLRWVAVLLDIAVITISLCIWQALLAHDANQIKRRLQSAADHIRDDLGAEIDRRALALVRMAAHWQAEGRPNQSEWTRDASLLIAHFGGIDSIHWDDATGQTHWTASESGKRLRGVELHRRSIAARRPSVGKPIITVVRVSGGASPDLIISAPVFRYGSIDGYVSAVVDIAKLLESSLQGSGAQRHHVAVLRDGQYIAGAKTYPGGGDSGWMRESALSDHNLGWTVRASPTPNWLAENRSVAHELVLLVGFVMTAILGFTVRLAQMSRSRTKDAERANAEMRKTIAERLQFEVELRKSQERFRTSVDTMLDGFGIAAAVRDKSGRISDFVIEYVNEAACAINQKTKEQMIGKRLLDIMPFPPESGLFDDYCRVVETGKPLVRELVIYGGSEHGGSDRPGFVFRAFDIRSAKLDDGLVVAWLDITERVRAQDAQRQFEARYRELFEGVPVGIYRTAQTGKILEANSAILHLLGYPDINTLRSINAGSMYADPRERERYLKLMESSDGPSGMELRLRRFDGSIIWVLDRARAVRSDKGQLLYYEGTLEDITERKGATEQLKKSLGEKEMLLKEIHHRVKNNLQVISSLLNLQSGYIKDKQSLEIFKESQNRVRSMALIHEKLYQSQDLARIDFSEYIRNLSVYLFRAYGVNSNRVALKIKVEDVPLSIDEAVPCGLIINELVSNSLKHAFPVSRAGEISISLSSIGEEKYSLIVSDDGIGLPKDFDIEETGTLGLQLVTTLAGQLGGQIDIANGNGAEFRVTFPS